MSEDKVIIVTGASSDIGMATIAEYLIAYPSCRIVAVTRDKIRCIKRFEDNEKISKSENIIIAQTDLSDLSMSEGVLEPIIHDLGRADMLANIAGGFLGGPFIDMEISDFQKIMGDNLLTAFTASKVILPFMINQRFGSIVFISSVLGEKPLKDSKCVLYGAAKAGIIQMSKLLAAEMGSYNINVNCICPGLINPVNDESANTVKDYEKLMEINKYIEHQPLKSFGSPSDIAKAIVFITGEGSSWTTGSVLNIDGGIRL